MIIIVQAWRVASHELAVPLGIRKSGLVAVEEIGLAVGADDLGAAAGDAFFVPGSGVLEGGQDKAEG